MVWAKKDGVWAKKEGVWAKKDVGLGKERGGSGQRKTGSGQIKRGVWAKKEGVWAKNDLTSAGPSTSCGGEFKASGVAGEPWRTWLGWGRRAGMGGRAGWVGAGWGLGWAGRGMVLGGQAGPGRAGEGEGGGGGQKGGGGTCRCAGNVGNVSEKLQTFRSKERAQIGFVGKERGVWAKKEGVWAKNAFCGKSEVLWANKNTSSDFGTDLTVTI